MNHEMLEKILSYIDAHIYEKINLCDLAELVNYSPFYFSKLFSETMGMPVTGYIRIRKLQYAIVSLLEGSKVLDVALLYAFDSHEGFTRAFKQLFGSTPSTIRKYLTTYVVPKYVIPNNTKWRGNMESTNSLQDSMYQIVFGYLEQSIEEAKDGFCTSIEVTLLPNNRIEITDNGRGLPLSKDLHASEEVLNKILAGSPITNAEYSQMGDLMQADLQTMNSLCESLQVIVKRDGEEFQQDYIRGIAQHDLYMKQSSNQTGTKIIMKPDSSIFGNIECSLQAIQNWIEEKTKGIDTLSIDVKSASSCSSVIHRK